MDTPGSATNGNPVRPSMPLRNLTAVVVSGSDGPTLQAALQALFAASTEGQFISLERVADYEVLVIYAE